MNTIFCSQGHENPHTNQFCKSCGEKLTPPVVSTLIPGAVLEGRYRLVQQIGQGGFGRTYLCEDLNRFNEPCVLKEFAPQVQGAYALEKAKKLFEREANVLYQLQHPQIPKFRELFQMTSGSGGLFLVQDFVAGPTYRHALNLRLQQGRTYQEEEVRQLLLSLLPVLEYTHSLGVIHRDIAPDNLICRASDGTPVLIDFGGVKQIAVNAEMEIKGNTEVPTRLGKVGYAPHEQMQRGTVFPHSDLYALAATCLVLLTGQEPTELIDPQTMTWNWRRVIQIQPGLAEVFDRMLQPKPTDRYQSASEVLKTLKNQAPPAVIPAPLPTPNPSTLGTVVVAPNPHPSPGPNSQLPGGEDGFLQILSRTWVGILGIAAAIGLGWAATSVLNKPQETPVNPIPATTTPSTESSSPSPSSSDTPSPSSSDNNIFPSSSPDSPPTFRQNNGSDNNPEPTTPRRRRTSNNSPSSTAPDTPDSPPNNTEKDTSGQSQKPSNSIKKPKSSTSIVVPKGNNDLFDNNPPPQPAEPEQPPSKVEPETKKSTSNSDGSADNNAPSKAPAEKTTPETPLF